MAPEQASRRGCRSSGRSVLAGSVMYAMMYGGLPSRASTLFAPAAPRSVRTSQFPVNQLQPFHPDWLVEIMKKPCMQSIRRAFQTGGRDGRRPGAMSRPCAPAGPDAATLVHCATWNGAPTEVPARRLARRAVFGCIDCWCWRLGKPRPSCVSRHLKALSSSRSAESKVKVTVDGKGRCHLGEGIAEVRLRAGQHKGRGWARTASQSSPSSWTSNATARSGPRQP